MQKRTALNGKAQSRGNEQSSVYGRGKGDWVFPVHGVQPVAADRIAGEGMVGRPMGMPGGPHARWGERGEGGQSGVRGGASRGGQHIMGRGMRGGAILWKGTQGMPMQRPGGTHASGVGRGKRGQSRVRGGAGWVEQQKMGGGISGEAGLVGRRQRVGGQDGGPQNGRVRGGVGRNGQHDKGGRMGGDTGLRRAQKGRGRGSGGVEAQGDIEGRSRGQGSKVCMQCGSYVFNKLEKCRVCQSSTLRWRLEEGSPLDMVILSKLCPRDSTRNHHRRRDCYTCHALLPPFSDGYAQKTAAAMTEAASPAVSQRAGVRAAPQTEVSVKNEAARRGEGGTAILAQAQVGPIETLEERVVDVLVGQANEAFAALVASSAGARRMVVDGEQAVGVGAPAALIGFPTNARIGFPTNARRVMAEGEEGVGVGAPAESEIVWVAEAPTAAVGPTDEAGKVVHGRELGRRIFTKVGPMALASSLCVALFAFNQRIASISSCGRITLRAEDGPLLSGSCLESEAGSRWFGWIPGVSWKSRVSVDLGGGRYRGPDDLEVPIWDVINEEDNAEGLLCSAERMARKVGGFDEATFSIKLKHAQLVLGSGFFCTSHRTPKPSNFFDIFRKGEARFSPAGDLEVVTGQGKVLWSAGDALKSRKVPPNTEQAKGN